MSHHDAPDVEMVHLTVDGKPVEAPKGTLLVEALRTVGIATPTFCYHPKLDPAGLCRMCLVEVEKMPKLITACTTPVAEGMVVHTTSESVVDARRGMLEFTLVNHPLDCPICDKGGECDLQDLTMYYGPAVSRLADGKVQQEKAVPLGPFIVLDQERCIMCRRCVRFDDEIARENTLIVGERGVQAVITTAEERPYDSYFSGNTIELCPVGALTSRPYRFRARPWDLVRVPSVCTHCSVGCNTQLDMRRGELLRVTSREHPQVDDGWLCDRGRFGYRHVHAEQRLHAPMLKVQGEFQEITWDEAFEQIRSRLLPLIREGRGSEVGIIGGGRLTNEEAYLLQKLGRAAIGTPNIDHRTDAQQVGSIGEYDGCIADLDRVDRVLLLDLELAEIAPVVDLRLRRQLRHRTLELFSLGGRTPSYREPIQSELLRPDQLAERLLDVADAIGNETTSDQEQEQDALHRFLDGGERILVFWNGTDHYEAVLALLDALNRNGKEAKLLIPARQHNHRGAGFMGLLPNYLPGYRSAESEEERSRFESVWARPLPDTPGLSTHEMLESAESGNLQLLYLVGANLLQTWPNRRQAARALAATPFVIAQDLFMTETAQQADLVLPAVSFAEKEGTVTNFEGRSQSLRQALEPLAAAQTDAAIFAALAEKLRYRRMNADEQALQAEMKELDLLRGHDADHQAVGTVSNQAHQVAVSFEEALGRVPSDALRPRDPALGSEKRRLANDPVDFQPGAPRELWEAASRAAQKEQAAASAYQTVRSSGRRLIVRLREPLFTGGGIAWHDKDLLPMIPSPTLQVHPQTAHALGWIDEADILMDLGTEPITVRVQLDASMAEDLLELTRALPGHPANLFLAQQGEPELRWTSVTEKEAQA